MVVDVEGVPKATAGTTGKSRIWELAAFRAALVALQAATFDLFNMPEHLYLQWA